MSPLFRGAFVLLALAGLLSASGAHAQTVPYGFSVERFSVPERGLFDEFDDGVLDAAWDGTVFGSVSESGSTLTLSNPGVFGFLPPPIETESTVISGQGLQLDFGGDMTATTVWTQAVPLPSQAFNFSLGSIDASTGNVHQYTVGISDTPVAVAAELGGSAGLGVSILSVVRDSGPGNILSLSRSSISILPGDITGDVHLTLAFDDATNTLQAGYSLDGGLTSQTIGAAEPWNFFGGGFSLSASSTVPEPGTAVLLGLGLMGLGRAREAKRRR
ncbi:MAG: PEP-CTERM sorting domain-containing protein [Myxococcota bacterium]